MPSHDTPLGSGPTEYTVFLTAALSKDPCLEKENAQLLGVKKNGFTLPSFL
jgi:hypothetical protein